MKSSLVSGLSDLAQAAYVNFGVVGQAGLASEELIESLEEANSDEWSQTRRVEFADQWRMQRK